MRVFKGTGVVLARIECSPKMFDFRANGILDQKSVDFFDTLRRQSRPLLSKAETFYRGFYQLCNNYFFINESTL